MTSSHSHRLSPITVAAAVTVLAPPAHAGVYDVGDWGADP